MLQLPEGIVQILFEHMNLRCIEHAENPKTIKGLFKTLKRFNREADLKKEDFLCKETLDTADEMENLRKKKKLTREFVKTHIAAGTEFYLCKRIMGHASFEDIFHKVTVIGIDKKVKWKNIRVRDEKGERFNAFQHLLVVNDPANPFVQNSDGSYCHKNTYDLKIRLGNVKKETIEKEIITLPSIVALRYQIPGITGPDITD